MMKAVRINRCGDADTMRYEDADIPITGENSVLVENKTIGVNYIDIYFRRGIYENSLPFTLGLEAAGVVLKAGLGVSGFKAGDRVAYTGVLGAYAQKTLVPADRLVKLPKHISFLQAASLMVQGITAQYLTRSTFPLKRGDFCLIQAAAGGVGILLCQMAKICQATAIGTVSSEQKALFVKKAGCRHVVIYTKEDFVKKVRKITKNQGVQVVYDGVGASTFEKSLDCLAPRGTMVLFGQSSGVVPPVDLNILNRKGSLYVARPGINAYIAKREEYLSRAQEVFELVRKKKLKIHICRTFTLRNAADAHRLLESRKSTGKILLIP